MDVNITRTEAFSLTCCIGGFPIPSVELYHNNSLVTQHVASFIPEQRLTNCSALVDSSAEYSDAGEYTCKGASIAGNVSSTLPAFVTVKGMM